MTEGTTGAERFVRELERAGVRVVFGLPGIHNMAAWEALGRSRLIRRIGVRHEQTAVYAADGWARATGEVGVALVTTGPGAANALAATGEAWASHSPVVVVATDIPAALRRPSITGGALHESPDQHAAFAPLTKATLRGEDPERISEALWLAARAPARPVFLEVPADSWAIRSQYLPAPEFDADVVASRPDVSAALAALAGTSWPLLVCGSGAVAAEASVGALAERLGAPVVTSFGARGLLAGSTLSTAGSLHLPAIAELWERADVVLAIGTDLDGPNTMNWRLAQPRRLVVINVDERDGGKNYRPDAVVAADAGAACHELLRLLPATAAEPWVDVPGLRRRVRGQLRAENPTEVAFSDAFARALSGFEQRIVVCDMCIAGYWLSCAWPPPAARRFQFPMGWGTLGYALPAAVGAAVAGPVVAVCGDGGFLMGCGELATIAQERLPVTVVLCDDGAYGMLAYEQQAGGRARDGVDLDSPDFAALGAAFGLPVATAEGFGDEFQRTLTAELGRGGPSLLVVRSPRLEPAPTTSPRWFRDGPPVWAGA